MSQSPTCPACGSKAEPLYEGPIRAGAPGQETAGVILGCVGCTLRFLSTGPIRLDAYENSDYRRGLGQDDSIETYRRIHDPQTPEKIAFLRGVSLRGKTIVDVGSGGGSFLDMWVGVAARTVAVEPDRAFHASLKERGHEVYPTLDEARTALAGAADMVTAFSVIEHVEDPVEFLAGIRRLLRPGGAALLSTPNARDVLVEVSDAYRRFFYRTQHHVYFDAVSLRNVATLAHCRVDRVEYDQRFGFGNFLAWTQLGRPTGDTVPGPLTPEFDRAWRLELARAGRADYLYAWLSAGSMPSTNGVA